MPPWWAADGGLLALGDTFTRRYGCFSQPPVETVETLNGHGTMPVPFSDGHALWGTVLLDGEGRRTQIAFDGGPAQVYRVDGQDRIWGLTSRCNAAGREVVVSSRDGALLARTAPGTAQCSTAAFLHVSSKGAYVVTLETGATERYRVRRLILDGGEISVEPDGGAFPRAPVINGAMWRTVPIQDVDTGDIATYRVLPGAGQTVVELYDPMTATPSWTSAVLQSHTAGAQFEPSVWRVASRPNYFFIDFQAPIRTGFGTPTVNGVRGAEQQNGSFLIAIDRATGQARAIIADFIPPGGPLFRDDGSFFVGVRRTSAMPVDQLHLYDSSFQRHFTGFFSCSAAGSGNQGVCVEYLIENQQRFDTLRSGCAAPMSGRCPATSQSDVICRHVEWYYWLADGGVSTERDGGVPGGHDGGYVQSADRSCSIVYGPVDPTAVRNKCVMTQGAVSTFCP
jgi:hypothetical protein